MQHTRSRAGRAIPALALVGFAVWKFAVDRGGDGTVALGIDAALGLAVGAGVVLCGPRRPRSWWRAGSDALLGLGALAVSMSLGRVSMAALLEPGDAPSVVIASIVAALLTGIAGAIGIGRAVAGFVGRARVVMRAIRIAQTQRHMGRHRVVTARATALALLGLTAGGVYLGLAVISYARVTQIQAASAVVAVGVVLCTSIGTPRLRRLRAVKEVVRWVALLAPAGGSVWAVLYMVPVLYRGHVLLLVFVLAAITLGQVLFAAAADRWSRTGVLAVMCAATSASLFVAAGLDGQLRMLAVVSAGFFSPAFNLLLGIAGEQTKLHAERSWWPIRIHPGVLTALLNPAMIGIAAAVRGGQAQLVETPGRGATWALGFGAAAALVAAPAMLLAPRTLPDARRGFWESLKCQGRLVRRNRFVRLAVVVAFLNGPILMSWDAQHSNLLAHDGLLSWLGSFGSLFLIGALLGVWVQHAGRKRPWTVIVLAGGASLSAWAVCVPGALMGWRTIIDDFVANLPLEWGTTGITMVTLFIAQKHVATEDINEATAVVGGAKSLGSMVGTALSGPAFGAFDGRPLAGMTLLGGGTAALAMFFIVRLARALKQSADRIAGPGASADPDVPQDPRSFLPERRKMLAGSGATALLVVAGIGQYALGSATGVLALQGDALHNLIDAADFPIQLAAAGLVGLCGGPARLVDMLATAAIVGLMLLSAGAVARVALRRLLEGGPVPILEPRERWALTAAAALAVIVNLSVAAIRNRFLDDSHAGRTSITHAVGDAAISLVAVASPWLADVGRLNAALALAIAAAIAASALWHARELGHHNHHR